MRQPDDDWRQALAPAFFDAHCDTVMKVLDTGADFLDPKGHQHLSFPGMIKAGVRAQIFACYVLSAHYPRREYARACAMIDGVQDMADSTQGGLRIARSRDDLQQAFAGGPRAGIVSLEGADPLGASAETIHDFFERGVRSLIFAWQDNAFSGTAFGHNTSLTSQGRRLLGLCEELGIVVDVSHLSDAAFDEVAQLSTRPFVASHSDCRALCPSVRNLTDTMIRTLADRGGVMGINLSPAFLDPGFAEAVRPFQEAARIDSSSDGRRERQRQMLDIPRPSMEWVVRHVLHAINVGGEDCIGLGGDLDGISQTPAGVDTVADYSKFIPMFSEAGLSTQQIDKICNRNFLRVFSDVLPTS